MKKKRKFDWLLSLAILWLMLDVYYWSMRSTAGVLRSLDIIVCIATGILCVVIIIFVVVKNLTKKHLTEVLDELKRLRSVTADEPCLHKLQDLIEGISQL